VKWVRVVDVEVVAARTATADVAPSLLAPAATVSVPTAGTGETRGRAAMLPEEVPQVRHTNDP
jgi:hypothetical protein